MAHRYHGLCTSFGSKISLVLGHLRSYSVEHNDHDEEWARHHLNRAMKELPGEEAEILQKMVEFVLTNSGT